MIWLFFVLASYGFFVTLLLAIIWRKFQNFATYSMAIVVDKDAEIIGKDAEIARLRRLVRE